MMHVNVWVPFSSYRSASLWQLTVPEPFDTFWKVYSGSAGVVSISVTVVSLWNVCCWNSIELIGGVSGGSRFAFPPEVGKSRSNIFVCTTEPGGSFSLLISKGRTTVVLARLHSTRLVIPSESEEPGRLCFFQQKMRTTTSAISSTHAQTHPTIIQMSGPESPVPAKNNNIF